MGNEEETPIDRMYIGWYAALEACLQQLQQVDSVTRQLQMNIHELPMQAEFRTLRNRILLQKNMITAIVDEVKSSRHKYEQQDKKQVSMADLLENNRLREKIRKAEQSTFMLKHQVNHLLSKAS